MMQQILAQINANQEKADASMAKLEKIEETMERQMKHLMMVKCNTHQEMTEIDPDTEMMQSAEKHQDIPNNVAAGMPVRRLGSGVGSGSWPRRAAGKARIGPKEFMDPGGRCPAMKEWHGTK
jgi:hypothetical protein